MEKRSLDMFNNITAPELQVPIVTLFLMTREEKIKLPKEILIRNVTVSTDIENLNDLVGMQYNAICFSENICKSISVNDFRSFVKLNMIYRDCKIIYIKDKNSPEDVFESILYSVGNNNIYTTPISDLTIDIFDEMVQSNNVIEPIDEDDGSNEKNTKIVDLLLTEINAVGMEQITPVLERNKNSIFNVLNLYKFKLQENSRLQQEKQELLNEVSIQDSVMKSMEINISKQGLEIDNLKSQLRDLRMSVLSTQEKMKEYNYRLIDNKVDESYLVNLDLPYNTIVLYFKELEDIGFLEYLEGLLYTLKIINKKYIKTVILEKHDRVYFNPYTKLDYHIIGDTTEIKDVINYDKLVRYGNAKNLLHLLNKPEMKVEVIVIYDKTMSDKIHVHSDKLIPFYIGNHRGNYPLLEIDDTNFISTKEGDWKMIEPLISGYGLIATNNIQYNMAVSLHPLTTYIMDSIKAIENETVEVI